MAGSILRAGKIAGIVIVVIIVVAVGLAAGLTIMVRMRARGDGDTSQTVSPPPDSVSASLIEKEDYHNRLVRSEIFAGNVGRVDSMGVKNHLPGSCDSSTPLVEIRTFERQLDGSIQPFVIADLGVFAQEPLSGCQYAVGGCGLRIALGKELDGSLYLLYDTEYTVSAVYHRPDDPPNIIRGKTRELIFRTPAKPAPGAIYRVDLILVDRIKRLLQNG